MAGDGGDNAKEAPNGSSRAIERLAAMATIEQPGTKLGVVAGDAQPPKKKQIWLPKEVLASAFSNLTRLELDSMQMVSRQFADVIVENFDDPKKAPVRYIYAMRVDRYQRVTVQVVEGDKSLKSFSSVDEFLEIRRPENLEAHHLLIWEKGRTQAQVTLLLDRITEPTGWGVEPLFYMTSSRGPPPDGLIPAGESLGDYRYFRATFDIFYTQHIQVLMPPDGSRFNISIGDLTKWLEWRSDRDLNASLKMKTLNCNSPYLFEDGWKGGLAGLCRHFRRSKRPCPYEITITDPFWFSSREPPMLAGPLVNRATGELLEMIMDYRTKDWKLRRRMFKNRIEQIGRDGNSMDEETEEPRYGNWVSLVANDGSDYAEFRFC